MALYAFDGTWNSDEDPPVEQTNVLRFMQMYDGRSTEYRTGVGTRFGKLGRIAGGLLGAGGRSRIDEMYEELCENWRGGDRTIDIVGFSRGGALALHFANKIADEGVDPGDGPAERVSIRFLGLWDVVGSFGLSFDTLIDFQEIDLGWDINRVSSAVQRCCHAMALDERRETFSVRRLNPGGQLGSVEEVWFRGVHSDIGGGNSNIERSNIALQWMVDRAREAGVPIDEASAGRPHFATVDRLAPIFDNTDIKLDERREQLPSDQYHESANGVTLQPGESRTCRVIASRRYNWSGLQLERGARYRIQPAPGDTWADDDIVCGPLGWDTDSEMSGPKEWLVRRFERFRRLPGANWFALIGTVGNDDDDLLFIGAGLEDYRAQASGEFYLFANDMRTRYDNNRGSIAVTITRLA